MTTFVLPTEQTDRIDQALAQRVCTAADGSYIIRSNGRRKAGRPSKYFIHWGNGRLTTTITAFSDEEAVEKANGQ